MLLRRAPVLHLAPLVLLVAEARAQDAPPQAATLPAAGPVVPQPCDPAVQRCSDDPVLTAQPEEKKKGHRLFPLFAQGARDRGFRVPEPWGLGVVGVLTDTKFKANNLSAIVAKGVDPSPDADLIPLPEVTAKRLEGKNHMIAFKADLWLLPGVNVFATVGNVRGTNDIDVDIDLDALVPFPFCRPAKPCGTLHLPVETDVDNTTVTLGTLLVYGSAHWFVAGSVAKTVSVSSKERSDVNSTNLGLRAGPRFALDKDTFISPYVGGNYFDLTTRVKGLVRSGPVFEDGDAISLRYEIDMAAMHPWAGVAGISMELGKHAWLQGEVQLGQSSTRVLVSNTVRF